VSIKPDDMYYQVDLICKKGATSLTPESVKPGTDGVTVITI
jgi:hypothetical protein